ncbi:DNAJ protein JJJ1-like [Citrus sinensis]|nr:DNAJ protein JJJ1-like [Citrus sinensis]
MASEKRCLYEVLGLRKECTTDEIRSAYKKLALQRHPDKLVQSGLSQAEATAQFQELVHAYEVLSDPKERAWYDSHRSQILFSDLNSASNCGPVPNLYSYFSNTAFSGYSDSGKGFYKVYSDLFNKIYLVEVSYVKKLGLGLDVLREAPIMGNLESPYGQVTAFYNYWLGFSTVMDFCWVDEYDVMAGPNRKSRRVMEEENKKLRKKAKREYNETVRELAAFVKKRDKRVMDMMVKKNEEIERKREEEKERKKRLEKERMERAKRYEEPAWARIDDEGDNEVGNEEGLEEEEIEKKRSEFYCVLCGKKFKSEKQWTNHEQSKKHKEKVADLRESFVDEDEVMADFGELDGEVEELGERFKDNVGVEEREIGSGVGGLSGDEDVESEFFDVADGVEVNEVDDRFGKEDEDEDEDADDEVNMLKAMLSGHKNRKRVAVRKEDEVLKTEAHVENEIGESEFMEYDNCKSTRRKNKKDRGKKSGGEAAKGDRDGFKSTNEEANGHHNSGVIEESSSHSCVGNKNNGISDNHSEKDPKIPDQPVDGKGTKKDRKAKLKNSSKGNKTKILPVETWVYEFLLYALPKSACFGYTAASKNSSNVCEKCGQEFETRQIHYSYVPQLCFLEKPQLRRGLATVMLKNFAQKFLNRNTIAGGCSGY